MPNRLANETSPYLLQHKDNPVDWYPWGPEALARAKAEDKPILLSIGYSSCHWCHVMAHESFSDPAIAKLMNDNFVCIKVDREERPDLDQIYMTAVQAMTGYGGWPLNVFLTPDGVPFYGGTYWPLIDRQGMPSFRRVLETIADTYRNRRADVDENAGRLRDYLTQLSQATPETTGNLSADRLDRAVRTLESQFDSVNGGFGRAPKFPQPQVLDFLLRTVRHTGDAHARMMVQVTLDHMAAGGIYDQIGGGFHRYSVDDQWLVPHFEKMLYDNAQLARLYLDAARAFGREDYRRVAEETLDYVVREMTAPEGGFYSAQDADSEGQEGKFYTWTPSEIEAVLGPETAATVMAYYGVTPQGNFEGGSILHRRLPADQAVESVAHGAGSAAEESILAEARAKLREARAQRVWPARDDKVITAWNGMMLRAMAEGARALGREDLLRVAERNGALILDQLVHDGQLARTWREGQAKGNGYLEDYANAADGLLALYQATFDRRWIDGAIGLVDEALVRFGGDEDGLLYDTPREQSDLLVRPRELQDGATPSGNSVMADVCLRLWVMTEREPYLHQAEMTLHALADAMIEVPLGFGRILGVAWSYVAGLREITFAGDRTSAALAELRRVVDQRYEPNAILAYSDPGDPSLVDRLPILQDRAARDGQPVAYVCEYQTCLPPLATPAELNRALEVGVRGWTA